MVFTIACWLDYIFQSHLPAVFSLSLMATITNIGSGSSDSILDSGSALVCVTSEVNTRCCRRRDGGNVGEWHFPNGTVVPRRRASPDGDFTRTGYTHQVRLNRMNDAMGPVGTYTCTVPDAENGKEYSATITLGEVLARRVEIQWEG